MGFLDQWPFKSRARQEEERQATEQLYFPLGGEQKHYILAVLAPLVRARMSKEEKLFCYLCAKEIYQKGEGSEAAVAGAYAKMRELRLKDIQDRHVMMALLRLETRISALEDFPSAEIVQARAQLEDEG